MNYKKTLTLLLISFVTYMQAQKNFEKFAVKQDSLCVLAYDKKDDKKYEKLLNEFLARYNKLDSAGKKYFSHYLNGIYYNQCCLYSLQNNKSLALSSLEKAIKVGYNNYAHIQEDTDLDNIRNEAKFKTLIQPLRETGDYLYILRKAEKYNSSDNRKLPTFTYQASDNPHLVALRKAFNLDSVAGTGNEVSKILNLLHWIHNLVPHDGNHGNPDVMNAMNMIAVCKKGNRGLNCRGLATVLNECYLSLGIKSRFITCMPKDSLQTDQDCHVINMVYCNSLKKWLWIDPTNDAYVMNEKGELLSIEEVRDRIINNTPLILNPDANWNHQVSKLKEDYLFNYMAKNLYKLECPVSSEYDLETKTENKKLSYITLLPLDYYKQFPDKEEHTNTGNKTTFITYLTNNPQLFWQAP